MVKTFVMICILYATSTSSPAVSEPSKGVPIENPPSNVQQLPDKPQNTNKDAEKLDYVTELKKLGYYKEDTGNTDLNIRNAVIHFQSDLNFEVTGIWDEQCLKALKKRIKDTAFSVKDLINNPPTKDKWIAINKSKRTITLYKDRVIFRKYPVAVGNPPSLTPSGKYYIANKIVDPYWGGGGYAQPVQGGAPNNPLGHRWMGLSVGGGDSYGVHGNTAPYSIGTNASHGCIRMVNKDVAELFEIVPLNTPVWIGTNEDLKAWGLSQNNYLTDK